MFSENAVKVDKIFRTFKNKVFLKMQSQTIEIFVCALKITMKSQFQTNPNIPFDKEKGMLDSKNFTTFFYSLNKLSENELLLCVNGYGKNIF